MTTYRKFPISRIPPQVLGWLLSQEAWLTGSGVDWFMSEDPSKSKPKDLDIMVPPRYWLEVCRSLNQSVDVEVNLFGGLKFDLEGFSVDLWPGTLDDLYQTCSPGIGFKALRLKPYTLVEASTICKLGPTP